MTAIRVHGGELQFLYKDDALRYLRHAEMITAGKDLSGIFDVPFYPSLLAAIFKIFGFFLILPPIVNILLFAVSAYFVHAISKSLFGAKAALVSLILYGVYPTLFIYSFLPYTEPLFLVFLTSSAYFILLFLEKRSALILILASTLTVCAALTKEVAVLLPVAYVLVLWTHLGIKKALKPIALLLGIYALLIAPTFILNQQNNGHFALSKKSSKLIGNFSSASRESGYVPYLFTSYFKRSVHFYWGTGIATAMKLTGRDAQNFKGENDPKSALVKIVKAGPQWLAYELFSLSFISVVYGLAIGSFIKRIQRRDLLGVYFLSIPIIYFLVMCSYWMNARYFVPIIPFLCILASGFKVNAAK